MTPPGGRLRVAAPLLAAVAAVAASGLGASPAAAADKVANVSVVRPERGDPMMMEVATRAWAELTACGFTTALVDHPVGAAPTAAPAAATPGAPDGRLTLTVATYRRVDETITEVELMAPGNARLSVRRTVVIARDAVDPKLLAIRAVELVHAMVIEAAVAPDAIEAPAAVVAVDDDELPGDLESSDPPTWAVGAGVTMLEGFGGLDAGYGGVVHVDYHRGDGFGASALVGRAGFGGQTATTRGAFSMVQDLAAGEITYQWRRDARVRPQAALGLGVYHGGGVFAAGWNGQPATSESVWSPLIAGGGGLVVPVGGGLELYADGQALFAYPHPSVVTTSNVTLTAAAPSLLITVGLQRAF